MDFIGNFLTTIRNATKANKPFCVCPFSNMCERIASILQKRGFIRAYEIQKDTAGRKVIKIVLKYVKGESALVSIDRHSKPGCRLYYSCQEIPKVLGGLGMSILTTSKGVMDDYTARRQKCGGEVICTVF